MSRVDRPRSAAAQQASATSGEFDLSRVPKERRDIVRSLLSWHDADAVSDAEVTKVRAWLDANTRFAAKQSIFYKPSELRFLQHAGGPGVVDPEGWVRAAVPGDAEVKLKLNVLSPKLELVDDAPPAPSRATIAERLAKLQELAARDPEYAARVATPEKAFASLAEALKEGGGLAALGFIVPGSAASLGEPLGLAQGIDDALILSLAQESLMQAFATAELKSSYKEVTGTDGVVSRIYDVAVGKETGSQAFKRYGKAWLVDLSAD